MVRSSEKNDNQNIDSLIKKQVVFKNCATIN